MSSTGSGLRFISFGSLDSQNHVTNEFKKDASNGLYFLLQIVFFSLALVVSAVPFFCIRYYQGARGQTAARLPFPPRGDLEFFSSDSILYHLSWDLPFYSYLPIIFVSYTVLSGWEVLLVFLAVLGGYIPFAYIRVSSKDGFLKPLSVLFPFLGLTGAFFIRTYRTKIWKHCVAQCIILTFGVLLLLMFRTFPVTQSNHRAIIVLVVLPVMREVTSLIGRLSLRYLAIDSEIGGLGKNAVKVRRSYSWWVCGYIQFMFATTVRLIFTNFSDPGILSLVMVYQSALEIGLRLTILPRDKFVKKGFACIRNWVSCQYLNKSPSAVHPNSISSLPGAKGGRAAERRQGSSANMGQESDTEGSGDLHAVAARPRRERKGTLILSLPEQETVVEGLSMISSSKVLLGESSGSSRYSLSRVKSMTIQVGRTASIARNETDKENAEKACRSMFLILEMLGEYIGIFMAFFLAAFYQDDPLRFPMTIYSNLDDPFEPGALSMLSLTKVLLTQLVFEFFTDWICIVYEARKGFPLSAIWHGRHKYFCIYAILATWFASCCIFVYVTWAERVDVCSHTRNICWCNNGNGLIKDGLSYRYCYLLYNETGMPAGDMPPPPR